MRKLYFISILLSLLLFSCNQEHLEGEMPDTMQAEANNIAENGLDLTPFLHLDNESLDILKALEFPKATRGVDLVMMSPEAVEIPGLGQTRTFTLQGNSMANNIEIVVREIYTGEIARATAVNVANYKVAQIYFPPYTNIGGSSRVYIMEYIENGGTPQTFTVLLQNPINASFLTNLATFDYTIDSGGGAVTIYKHGTYPATSSDYIDFRFAVNQDPDNFISTVTLNNPALRQIDIQVPANTGQARSLTLYMRAPDSDWIILDHCIQLGGTGGSANVLTDWVVTRTYSDPLTVYGGTALVGISGDYHGLEVRLWTTNSLGQELTTEVKTLNEGEFPPVDPNFDLTPYDGALAFKIPAFEDNGWAYNLDRRYLYHSGNSFVWYAQVNTGDGWKIIGSNTHGSNQLPQPWSRISISETLDYAQRAYSTWPVQISGYWENQTSNRLVHLWVVTDPFNPEGTVLGITRLDPRTMGMSPSVVQLDIPANRTGKIRTLYVVFSLDEGRTWNRWYSGWNGNGSVTQAAS